MKSYFLVFAIAIISCGGAGNGGNNNPTPNPNNPNNPSTVYFDILNWDSTMLYGEIVTTPQFPNGGMDSMAAYKKNGLACIKYRGVEYSLKRYNPAKSSPQGENEKTYLVDVFLNNNYFMSGMVSCPRYMENGQWIEYKQIYHLEGGQLPSPFNQYLINAGGYFAP